MAEYMEFQGKSLDLAINEACTFFGVGRDKLEIEIVSDAKAGIFGLVGVKKAKVKARRVRIDSGSSYNEPQENAHGREQAREQSRDQARDQGREAKTETRASSRDPQVKEQADKPEKKVFDRKKPRRDYDEEREAPQAVRPRAAASPVAATPSSGSRWGYLNESDDMPVGTPVDNETIENTNSNARDSRISSDSRRENNRREPRDSRAPRASGFNTTRRADPRRNSNLENKTEARVRTSSENSPSTTSNRHSEQPAARQGFNAGRPRAERFNKPTERTLAVSDAPLEDGDLNLIEEESVSEGFAYLDIAAVGADKVIEETTKVVTRIVDCIVDDATYTVEINEDNKIKVMIDAGESSGLLIGRYSQTLTAIQYMVSRVLTRVFAATTRVQIDAGDYRERQDDKVRELALNLAERVREEGRGLYTRPLSSYHRRVVHMALQDDPDLQTRSKGEGTMKRVLIIPRRK